MLVLIIPFVPNTLLEMKCGQSHVQEPGWQCPVTDSAPEVGLTHTLCPPCPSGGRTPSNSAADPQCGNLTLN